MKVRKELTNIIYEKEGNIATVTLNRPEKLNAIDAIGRDQMMQDFWGAFDEAAWDDDIKVVILKGTKRAFSVGHDLTRVGVVYGLVPGERRPSQRTRLMMDRRALNDDMINHLFLHPKITIAQVEGYCIAGGTHLVSLCDLAITAEDATFGLTEQRLGFGGSGVGSINILIATIGLKRALDLFITGRTFDGKEAERMGLVNKAVPVEKLEEEVNKLAKAITLMPRDGIAIGKATRHLVYDSMGLLSGGPIGYYSHTLFTNLRWEPDEYNFFKERKDKGAKDGFHGRDDRYSGLV